MSATEQKVAAQENIKPADRTAEEQKAHVNVVAATESKEGAEQEQTAAVELSQEDKIVDELHARIFDKKIDLSSIMGDREKIDLLGQLFPLYFEAMEKVKNPSLLMVLFKWGFLDWCHYVCKHIMADDIQIKDPEIEAFSETLTRFFELVGGEREAAYDLAKSADTQAYIESNFGYLALILAVEDIADPQYKEYVELLRAKGKVYPKLQELIDEVYENLSTEELVN